MTGQTRPVQRGATLVIGLIMLVLITLMLITAFNLGTANFQTVSNVQFREEALAAANKAIQQVVETPFTTSPQPEQILVDMDNDGSNEYVVQIAQPYCVSASIDAQADPSSLALPGSMSAESTWNTVWDLDATVAGTGNTGQAAVRVRTGVRVLMSQSQKDAVCL